MIMTEQKMFRVLIFVVAYNAERTLENVFSRIPARLAEDYDVEILATDDASAIAPSKLASRSKARSHCDFRSGSSSIRLTRATAVIKRSDIITRSRIISMLSLR